MGSVHRVHHLNADACTVSKEHGELGHGGQGWQRDAGVLVHTAQLATDDTGAGDVRTVMKAIVGHAKITQDGLCLGGRALDHRQVVIMISNKELTFALRHNQRRHAQRKEYGCLVRPCKGIKKTRISH